MHTPLRALISLSACSLLPVHTSIEAHFPVACSSPSHAIPPHPHFLHCCEQCCTLQACHIYSPTHAAQVFIIPGHAQQLFPQDVDKLVAKVVPIAQLHRDFLDKVPHASRFSAHTPDFHAHGHSPRTHTRKLIFATTLVSRW